MEEWAWVYKDATSDQKTTSCQGNWSASGTESPGDDLQTEPVADRAEQASSVNPAVPEIVTSFVSLLNEESPDLSFSELTGIADMMDSHVCFGSLLNSGVDLNAVDREGATHLIKAARRGHVGCAEDLLLKSGADVNWSTHNGSTALIESATYEAISKKSWTRTALSNRI